MAKKCTTKRDARAKLLFCLVKLLLFLISNPVPPHLKLPITYDTLWSVRNRIFSVQIELLLLIASEMLFDSSVVPLIVWLAKLGGRTGQLWRDNSRLVRTHENNSGETVRRLGTIIQSIFCAQSGASIRLTVWKWPCESRYPGAPPPVLENFRRAISPGPTDCPWISEDVLDPDLEIGRGEGRSSRPLHKGGRSGLQKKNCFSALWASVWSKNKGGPGLLVPYPGYATVLVGNNRE